MSLSQSGDEMKVAALATETVSGSSDTQQLEAQEDRMIHAIEVFFSTLTPGNDLNAQGSMFIGANPDTSPGTTNASIGYKRKISVTAWADTDSAGYGYAQLNTQGGDYTEFPEPLEWNEASTFNVSISEAGGTDDVGVEVYIYYKEV